MPEVQLKVQITDWRRLFLSIPLVLGLPLAACQRAPIAAPDALQPSAVSGAGANQAPASTPAAVNAQIAELRRLTAHFRDLNDAVDAGYSAQITPCLALPGVGAMGFHYGNPQFINNDTVSLLEPELLLYEPQKDGSFRFVGVEYIIPFDFLPADATPPTLLGQTLHQNFDANLWALHVWVGRDNPAGIFEDWNPKVSCEFAN
jgi:hypothetical protein